jgi:hypothetical protein
MKNMKGDYEVLQANGGIWAYMEKSSALRDKSVLGLQIDSKLQTAVENFRVRCQDAAKKPDSALFNKIMEKIGQARTINNRHPGQTPIEKILTDIEALKKELDGLSDFN